MRRRRPLPFCALLAATLAACSLPFQDMPDEVRLTDVQPSSAFAGQLVTISGHGFAPQPTTWSPTPTPA